VAEYPATPTPGFAEEPTSFEPAPARAKLFKHGGSQAVRLPKAFRFEGEEVSIRRDGERVVLEPLGIARPPGFKRPRTREEMDEFWRRLDAIKDDEPFPFPPEDTPWPERGR
jgi:antitoxin VapB